MELTLFKIDQFTYKSDEENKLPQGQELHCKVITVPDKKLRSYQQLKTWRQALKFCVYHLHEKYKYLNTEEKMAIHVKMTVRAWDEESPFTYYKNHKTGKETAVPILKSVSYETMEHLEACNFFNDAFSYMAMFFDLTKDEFVEKVKKSVGMI